jgi:molecular chaperone GrpE (heat shock protein)
MASAKKTERRPKSVPGREQVVDALADAAWAEADKSLAEALADFDEFELTQNPRRRRQLLSMLGQALARTARKRGLRRLGTAGGDEPFDPSRHELVTPQGERPHTVEIVVRGVARGDELLAKVRVRKRP